jgi:hypothetical protein
VKEPIFKYDPTENINKKYWYFKERRICENCGNEYYAKSRNQRYCYRAACRNLAKKESRNKAKQKAKEQRGRQHGLYLGITRDRFLDSGGKKHNILTIKKAKTLKKLIEEGKVIKRKCLKCDHEFYTDSKFIRICAYCMYIRIYHNDSYCEADFSNGINFPGFV